MAWSMQAVLAAAGITTGTADYEATTLSLLPQNVYTEEMDKTDVIRSGDDGSEERIEVGGSIPSFRVQLEWDTVPSSEEETILNFWTDPAKGRGRINTFLWQHPWDGYTYIVRFDSKISRQRRRSLGSIPSVTLRVLGFKTIA